MLTRLYRHSVLMANEYNREIARGIQSETVKTDCTWDTTDTESFILCHRQPVRFFSAAVGVRAALFPLGTAGRWADGLGGCSVVQCVYSL